MSSSLSSSRKRIPGRVLGVPVTQKREHARTCSSKGNMQELVTYKKRKVKDGTEMIHEALRPTNCSYVIRKNDDTREYITLQIYQNNQFRTI